MPVSDAVTVILEGVSVVSIVIVALECTKLACKQSTRTSTTSSPSLAPHSPHMATAPRARRHGMGPRMQHPRHFAALAADASWLANTGPWRWLRAPLCCQASLPGHLPSVASWRACPVLMLHCPPTSIGLSALSISLCKLLAGSKTPHP